MPRLGMLARAGTKRTFAFAVITSAIASDTPNNDVSEDLALIEQAGLSVEPPSPSC